MQFSINSAMEKSGFFAEGETSNLSEIFGIYFKMRANLLLINNQLIIKPSRLVRPLKNALFVNSTPVY